VTLTKPSPSEITSPPDTPTSPPAVAAKLLLRDPANWPVAVLGLMMFMLPAVGVPNELMLQDTLKSAVAAFGVLGAALLFFWQQRHRTEPLLWHGMVWLPVVLMLYALGSMVWSHTYLAGVEAIRWFILSLLMWLGLNTLTRHNLPLLLWGIHAGAVVASLWAVLQFWFDLQLFPQAAPPSSTFINRNFFAEYAVTVLPFSVYLLANARASRWLPWVAFSVALNTVALLMTGTRSALVALLLLVPVLAVILIRYRQQLAFWHWRRDHQAMVGIILVAGVWGMGSVPSANPSILQEGVGATALQRSFHRAASMTERQEYTERSFSVRSQMWMATARMMIANPWTGVGAGAWEVQIPLYQRDNTTLETDYYAHNEWLQLLSEYGVLVGGLVMAFFLAYLLMTVGRIWPLNGSNFPNAAVRATSLASLIALCFVSNAGFPWHLATTGVLMALCLAILARTDIPLDDADGLSVVLPWQPGFSRIILCVLVSCLLLASMITNRAISAESNLVQGLLLADRLRQSQHAGAASFEDRKAQALAHLRLGIALNPHYRKVTAEAAEPFAAGGDWANAVWILASVAQSRPNVYAIWVGLANGYSQLGQHDQAAKAMLQVKRLKPEAISTHTLEVLLLSRQGQTEVAAQLVNRYYDQNHFDYDMVQAGYAIAYQASNWSLAIRSLNLRAVTWPQHAPDAYFRMGKVYNEVAIRDEAKAIEAFENGLNAVPDDQAENYLSQVPAEYRSRIKKHRS
jgi:O-antigen ligase/tetratricopeptide (TPR) repeat protein